MNSIGTYKIQSVPCGNNILVIFYFSKVDKVNQLLGLHDITLQPKEPIHKALNLAEASRRIPIIITNYPSHEFINTISTIRGTYASNVTVNPSTPFPPGLKPQGGNLMAVDMKGNVTIMARRAIPCTISAIPSSNLTSISAKGITSVVASIMSLVVEDAIDLFDVVKDRLSNFADLRNSGVFDYEGSQPLAMMAKYWWGAEDQ